MRLGTLGVRAKSVVDVCEVSSNHICSRAPVPLCARPGVPARLPGRAWACLRVRTRVPARGYTVGCLRGAPFGRVACGCPGGWPVVVCWWASWWAWPGALVGAGVAACLLAPPPRLPRRLAAAVLLVSLSLSLSVSLSPGAWRWPIVSVPAYRRSVSACLASLLGGAARHRSAFRPRRCAPSYCM